VVRICSFANNNNYYNSSSNALSGNNKTNTSANVKGAFRVEFTLRHEAHVHSAMQDNSPIYPTLQKRPP
jgi:hypothetical protein